MANLLSKQNAIKIHYGKVAAAIRRDKAHRFIGSRFVFTRKPQDEGQEVDRHDLSTLVVKGRWCLQGHLDPDLQVKAEEGLLKSLTLSQLGRMILLQILASNRWQTAWVRPVLSLFAHQPSREIPVCRLTVRERLWKERCTCRLVP